jgi:hypothetical protein
MQCGAVVAEVPSKLLVSTSDPSSRPLCRLVSCLRNSMHFVAIKMGRRQGGPSRTGGGSGASRPIFTLSTETQISGSLKMERGVTDEQRGRRPIFIAILWAGASWLFFCVALSARMIQIGALRSRLEKQPTDLRQNTCYFGDRTLVER